MKLLLSQNKSWKQGSALNPFINISSNFFQEVFMQPTCNLQMNSTLQK